ncbi:DUF4231 domain-containing protein [Bradyrhizobium pachyrhizi]|uniref:DUF4231 domain-containing protein n=1 Tax=Bradyrhizobium pachyrhizi TaxID=280333 RepID=UPI001364BBF2|nr:DUF4231 domain-containing protein [Bradyrhizobium pachyrhizi]
MSQRVGDSVQRGTHYQGVKEEAQREQKRGRPMLGFWRRSEAAERKERQDQLRKKLLTEFANNRQSNCAQTAIAYCEYCITEYEEWFEFNEGRWLGWQKIAIIFGVAATLVAAITVPPGLIASYPIFGYFGWLRAIPAAIATVAATFLGSFMYREDAVRHELTANALWNELVKFQVGAFPYNNKDEAADTSAFMGAICRLIEVEVNTWGASVRGQREGDVNPPPGAPNGHPHASLKPPAGSA